MVNIFLCDDNEILLEKYCKQITALARKNQIEISLRTFASGEQLLFYMDENSNAADIIYLDIVMGGLNGIETAKSLRMMDCHAEIIFLTSSKEYVFDSFDSNPLYYIMKDELADKKFEEIFIKAVEFSAKRSSEVFLCDSGSTKKQIPLREISFFEVQNRTVSVHFDQKVFSFYSTLEKIEQELSEKRFARCHRAYIINLRYVDQITRSDVILTTGEAIPVGAAYMKNLKMGFSAHLADSF